MPDIPTCGYSLENGIFCREPRDRDRCTRHDQPSFSVCTGCSGRAAGECGAALSTGHPCLRPICNECRHVADGDMHIPSSVEGAESGPFAAQRPKAGQADVARTSLIKSVERTLERASGLGMLRFRDPGPGEAPLLGRLASLIVDDVTADALDRMAVGIAMGQVGG